jgi:hypothetical protein
MGMSRIRFVMSTAAEAGWTEKIIERNSAAMKKRNAPSRPVFWNRFRLKAERTTARISAPKYPI